MEYLGREISAETAVELMRKVVGPIRREIRGEEHQELLVIFALIDPVEVTNNQRSITEVYHQGGKIYHAHYFSLNLEPIIEEIQVQTA